MSDLDAIDQRRIIAALDEAKASLERLRRFQVAGAPHGMGYEKTPEAQRAGNPRVRFEHYQRELERAGFCFARRA